MVGGGGSNTHVFLFHQLDANKNGALASQVIVGNLCAKYGRSAPVSRIIVQVAGSSPEEGIFLHFLLFCIYFFKKEFML